MRTIRTVSLVTLRELRERGLSRSYLISWLVLVFLIGVGFTVPRLLDDGDEGRTYYLGLVGSGNGEAVEVARLMVADTEPPIRIETRPFSQRDDAARAVADDDIDAALVNGRELITPRLCSTSTRPASRPTATHMCTTTTRTVWKNGPKQWSTNTNTNDTV